MSDGNNLQVVGTVGLDVVSDLVDLSKFAETRQYHSTVGPVCAWCVKRFELAEAVQGAGAGVHVCAACHRRSEWQFARGTWCTWRQADPPPAPLGYPVDLTPELREVLGLQNFKTGPLADLHRVGGAEIPQRAEAEQAFVLHWLIRLALQHGPGWRQAASETIDGLEKLRRERVAGR